MDMKMYITDLLIGLYPTIKSHHGPPSVTALDMEIFLTTSSYVHNRDGKNLQSSHS